MDVLEYQRKFFLAAVIVSRLTYGASGWIGPKRFVVSSSIVITSETKSARCPQDEKCRRDRQDNVRHPCRPPTEPRVARQRLAGGFPDQRRIHRGQIRPIRVVRTLKSCPGRVDYECGKSNEGSKRRKPPKIPA